MIDEAGDIGLNNVQADPSHGPTQYFCMCASIFRDDSRSIIEDKLGNTGIGSTLLHANKLNHFEKVRLCQVVSNLPIGMIGVISNKLSLLSYMPRAKLSNTHFYNKVMQYLLERVGAVIERFQLPRDECRIFLEAREQRYSSLLSFIAKIQENPHDERAILLRNINVMTISAIKKSDVKCLVLSDIGAHALFSAVRRDGRSFGLSEDRYLRELSRVFLSDRGGRIVPKGIKPIHSVDDLELPQATADFFRDFRNPNPEYHTLE